MTHFRFALPLLASGLLAACAGAPSDKPPMGFFVTSTSMGAGADLGGLEGADRHCQALATAAGAGGRTWVAYLSTQSTPDKPGANARDRIGTGPWYNAASVLIATDVAELHSDRNRISKETALSERRTPTPGQFHDILTGTRMDGNAPSLLDPDMTCGNWTKNTPSGAALVGHHDRASRIKEAWATSWNSAHLTRGCSESGLKELGSGGLFYCFAK